MTENGTETWNLSNVAAGTYNLRVQNIMTWGQPKLLSVTLEYDGELPIEEALPATTNDALFSNQAYDLLGRPVDDSYQGIVIRNGKKTLQIAR